MIKVSQPYVNAPEIQAAADVLLSGNYVQGEKVREFEQEFAKYIGTRTAVAVNSGTAALQLALTGTCDHEVIVPPLTFFATIEAVLWAGATPVFADIDPETWLLDPSDVERKATSDTIAIVPVHLYGNVCEMDRLKNPNFVVVEDACQAHGSTYRGRRAGCLGDYGCFSFYATKNMTTIEGGMITTSYDDIGLRMMRNHGMSDRHTHKCLGHNFRMNEMQAAIGLTQLQRLEQMNHRRIVNSTYLRSALKYSEWLTPQKIHPHVESTFFCCSFLVDEEYIGMTTAELVAELRKRGLEVRYRYTEPLYRQPALEPFENYRHVWLENAEKICGKIIGLPNHPMLSEAELKEIVNILHRKLFK